MCLSYDKYETKRLQEKFEKKNRITVWKVVTKDEGNIFSPYRSKAINYGWFKSNRKSMKVTSHEISYGVDKGIHVLRTRKQAKDYLEGHFGIYGLRDSKKIIKCEACMRDFIGCDFRGVELVFTKIWVPKPKPKKKKK